MAKVLLHNVHQNSSYLPGAGVRWQESQVNAATEDKLCRVQSVHRNRMAMNGQYSPIQKEERGQKRAPNSMQTFLKPGPNEGFTSSFPLVK